MADVAARVGVSRQAVSIVLRGLPGASSEVRERVLQAAEELGYRAHMGARTLRQPRSGISVSPSLQPTPPSRTWWRRSIWRLPSNVPDVRARLAAGMGR